LESVQDLAGEVLLHAVRLAKDECAFHRSGEPTRIPSAG
jgi:hypothetical protein